MKTPWFQPGGASLAIASDAGFGANLDGETIEGVSNFEAWRGEGAFFFGRGGFYGIFGIFGIFYGIFL